MLQHEMCLVVVKRLWEAVAETTEFETIHGQQKHKQK